MCSSSRLFWGDNGATLGCRESMRGLLMRRWLVAWHGMATMSVDPCTPEGSYPFKLSSQRLVSTQRFKTGRST